MSASSQKRPNICLILVDSVRVDHLSCYGYSKLGTPHIDRIASEGVLYEQAIASASWTLQAVASLFTGLYPSQHHASWGHKFLDGEHITLAEMLARVGYHTVGWSANPLIDRSSNMHRGFQEFVQVGRLFQTSTRSRLQQLIDKGFARIHSYLSDKGGKRLTRLFQRNLGRLARNSTPFFLFMFYLEPHFPYRAQYKTARRMLPLDVSVSEARKINWRPNNYYVGKAEMSERDFEILTALYDAEIMDTDRHIGRTIDGLQQAGILDDTVVIFNADHGENIGHHGLMGHSHCLYDDLIRVPLIIRYPKLFTPGTRISEQVQIHDLVPTLLEIAGIDPAQYPAISHQYSLLPDRIKTLARRWTFAERIRPPREVFQSLARRYPGFDMTRYVRDLRAVRGDGWKYIVAHDGYEELFDLVNDPTEQDNLIHPYPDKARDLRQVLEEELPMGDVVSDEPDTDVDEAMLERLRALGYID